MAGLVRGRISTHLLLLATLAIAMGGPLLVGVALTAWVVLTLWSCALLVASPAFRASFIVVGGMLVLGSSSELSPLKIGYLIGAALAVGVGLLRLPHLQSSAHYQMMRPLLRASFFFAIFMAAELVLGMLRESDMGLALRDVAPYFLFSAVPLVALDVLSSHAQRWLRVGFVLVGVTAVMSFAIEWISKRGLADLAVSRVTLAGSLPVAFFSYAIANALLGKARARWTLTALLTLGLMLVTGNRSQLVILLAPLGVLLVSERKKLVHALFLAILVLLGAVASLPYLGLAVGVDTPTLYARFETLLDPERTFATDQSVGIRLEQTRVAWNSLQSSPFIGLGPGRTFEWVNPISGQHVVQNFSLDSPLLYPAKFGLLGVLMLLIVLAAYFRFLKALRHFPAPETAGLAGYLFVQVIVMLTLYPSIENKGFSFGLFFLLALSSLRLGHGFPQVAGSRPPTTLAVNRPGLPEALMFPRFSGVGPLDFMPLPTAGSSSRTRSG